MPNRKLIIAIAIKYEKVIEILRVSALIHTICFGAKK